MIKLYNKIDDFLLKNYPFLWLSKVVFILPISIIIFIVSVFIVVHPDPSTDLNYLRLFSALFYILLVIFMGRWQYISYDLFFSYKKILSICIINTICLLVFLINFYYIINIIYYKIINNIYVHNKNTGNDSIYYIIFIVF